MTYTGLSPDTLVSTNHGVIPVHCVTTAHKVKSFGGYKKIKNVQKYFDSPVVALENSNDLPLVGSPKTKILVKDSFCRLEKVACGSLVVSDSFLSLLPQDQDNISLIHYEDIKNNTKKKTALCVMLGCLLFSNLKNETLFLKNQSLIDSFRQATIDFGYQSDEVVRKDGTLFLYGHIPKLCSIFERYGLLDSLDNMVQDLILTASFAGKLAFIKTLLIWFNQTKKYQSLRVQNYILRRQLQVLFGEFGVPVTWKNAALTIPLDIEFQNPDCKQKTPILKIEKYGVSDTIRLTVEDDAPYLANTFLVKT